MARKNRPGAMARGSIKLNQYGPIMRDENIVNVMNLPAAMPHEGPARVTDYSGPGTNVEKLTLEYNNGKDEFAAVIRRNQRGILVCEYCSPDDGTGKAVSWCTHLHYLLVNREDTVFFAKPGRFVVPIVPSEGIYCPVHIGEPIQNERNKSLAEVSPVKIIMGIRDRENEDDTITLGYLRSNRISTIDLRNLFSDWAVGNLEDTKYYASTECKGDKHGKLKNDKLSEFAKRFYPAMYGLCPPCIEEFQGNSGGTVENPDADAPNF